MKPTPADNKTEIIDEIGALSLELIPFAAKRLRYDVLLAKVKTWAEVKALKPEAGLVLDGNAFAIAIGAQGNQRRILSIREIYRRIGITRFLGMVSLTLAALEEELGADAANYMTEERTGPRTYKPMARGTTT